MAETSLEAVLASREERSRRIQELLVKYSACVVVLTLNIPGPDKVPFWASQVIAEGVQTVRRDFSRRNEVLLHQFLIAHTTGFEWYGIAAGNGREIKKRMVLIEESHVLGRLFDIDIHTADGISLNRESLGFNPRRCLICHRYAHECGRSRRHRLEELYSSIINQIEEFFRSS